MTGKITIEVTEYPWECECCGSGDHYKIHIPEWNETYSENDQFGGKLDPEHDDFPEFVKYTIDPGYVISAFIKEGYEVTVQGYDYKKEWYEED